MRNHYATELGFPFTVHAFGSKRRRDEWIDGDWGRRAEERADYAHLAAICHGGLVLHGDAGIPRHWRETDAWDFEPTADPDVRVARLV